MGTEKLPSPKGPLEGSGEAPEVRPPDDAIVIGAPAERAEAPQPPDGDETARGLDHDAEATLRDRARTWVAEKFAPDSLELVRKSDPDEDDSAGAESDRTRRSPE